VLVEVGEAVQAGVGVSVAVGVGESAAVGVGETIIVGVGVGEASSITVGVSEGEITMEDTVAVAVRLGTEFEKAALDAKTITPTTSATRRNITMTMPMPDCYLCMQQGRRDLQE
jgi:hypothetical protein